MPAIVSTGRGRRRGLALAVACAISGVGVGAGLARRGGPVAVTEEAMRAGTDALVAAVGQARHTPVRADWDRKLVGAGELRAAATGVVRAGLAAGGADADADLDEQLFRRLGLMSADARYGDLIAGAVAREPAATYDPLARRLLVPSFIPLAEQRATLAHAIAHALQDQRVGLRRFLKVSADGRRGLSFDGELAREALIEGDATVLGMEAIDPKGTFAAPLELADLVDRARAAALDACERPIRAVPPPDDAASPSPPPPPSSSLPLPSPFAASPARRPPRFLCELIAFPYVEGLAFVAHTRAFAPWAAVDAIWARPPEATAQILHPRRYDRRQAPLELDLPALPLMGPALRLARADTLGELLVRAWLASPGPLPSARAGAPPDVADRAATGWRGDRVAIYLPVASEKDAPPDGEATPPIGGTPAALAWITAWDSDADADDFLQTVAGRLAALAAAGATPPDVALPIDASDHPAVWREPAGSSVFAIQRRGALVALMIGAPEVALPSLATMLDASSPARLERLRRSRAVKRDSR